MMQIEFRGFVFLNKSGKPVRRNVYDYDILAIAKKADIRKLSMYTLRHTFATRCIEGGMKPKTLQTILGHSDISITMDLYVHITEDEKIKEMNNIESMLVV